MAFIKINLPNVRKAMPVYVLMILSTSVCKYEEKVNRGRNMLETVEQKGAQFGAQVSPGSWLLSKKADIDKHQAVWPYPHELRPAWEELKLQGVLCVDGRPTVYLCAGVQFTTEAKRRHHSFVWNQGLVPLLIFLTPDHVEVHSTVKRPHKEPEEGLFEGDLPSLIPNLGNIAEALEAAKLVRAIETGKFFQDNAPFFR